MKKIALLSLVGIGLFAAGCSCKVDGCSTKSSCKAKTYAVKETKRCGSCKLVFEDGTPAPCCKTWKKPACNSCK